MATSKIQYEDDIGLGDNNFNVKIQQQDIIGIPPAYVYMVEADDLITKLLHSSMPVMAIHPALPEYGGQDQKNTGLQLYHLDYKKGLEKYNKILEVAGVNSESITSCIYVTFLNETSISESFSVEYGDSMFESLSNIGSDTIRELKAITGEDNIQNIASKIGDKMGEGSGFTGAIGSLMGMATKGVGKVAGMGADMLNSMAKGLGNLVTGSKVDFPMIWKGASYSPSYSMTVRLYNPYPASNESHIKFIIEPLAKLVALTVPISDSESTYSFPVMCSVTCPGLFRVKAGFVSSLEVVKGGEANSISFRQRPSMVDVRLTINELYGTMIAEGEQKFTDKYRPKFRDYVSQLISQAEIPKDFSTWIAQIRQYQDIVQIDAPSTTNTVATNENADPDTRVSRTDAQIAATLTA